MFKWLEKIFKKKNKSIGCYSCIYWKSEEENNKHFINPNFRYCDMQKKYKFGHNKCNKYIEEKFHPHEGSISTDYLNLDLDSSIEKLN